MCNHIRVGTIVAGAFMGALLSFSCTKSTDEDDDDDKGNDDRNTASAPTTCDGRPVSEAEELAVQLQLLGYGDFSDDSGAPGGDTGPGGRSFIIQDAEAWATLTGTIDVGVTLVPNFETDVVFVHHWVDGGCAEPYQYDAFRWNSTVRLRLFQPGRDNCDAYFPQLDLILVEGAADASDLGFCP